MTASEVLKAFPSSILIKLVDPYKKRVRFVRDDEYGQHYCDPPSDWRIVWRASAAEFAYKPVFRRKMGRA